MGKTRLVGDWAAAAGQGGAGVLWASCDAIGSPLPLQAPLDALHACVVGLTRDERHRLLGRDEKLLAPLLGLGPGDGEHGRDHGREQGSEQGSPPLEEGTGQVRLFGAVLGAAGRVSSRGPAILVLEDVHLADQATLAWLGFVARRTSEGSLLVVVTSRPEGAS